MAKQGMRGFMNTSNPFSFENPELHGNFKFAQAMRSGPENTIDMEDKLENNPEYAKAPEPTSENLPKPSM